MHVDVTWQPASSSMASADLVALMTSVGTGIDRQSRAKGDADALYQAMLEEKIGRPARQC